MSKEDKKNDLIGPPRLTAYEIARIIGARATQIAYGAPVLIPFKKDKHHIDEIQLAKMELKAKVLPLTVQRWLSDGRYKIIPIQDLELDENI